MVYTNDVTLTVPFFSMNKLKMIRYLQKAYRTIFVVFMSYSIRSSSKINGSNSAEVVCSEQ